MLNIYTQCLEGIMEKKYLFFTTPIFSHINSVLPIIKRLSRIKENEVYVVSCEKYKHLFENGKIKYICYPRSFLEVSFENRYLNPIENYNYILNIYDHLTPFAIEIIEKINPHCIIHDSLAGFAKYACRFCNKDAINMITTFAINNTVLLNNFYLITNNLTKMLFQPLKFVKLLKYMHSLKNRYQLKEFLFSDAFINKEKLNIVMTPKSIQPCKNSFKKDFYFVRPTVEERYSEKNDMVLPKNKPLIYVAFGTINMDNDIIIKIAKTLSVKDVHVIISSPCDLNIPYTNVKYVKSINQLQVLKKSSIFINHGGLNSIYEGIWNLVPQVCIPLCDERKINSSQIIKKFNCGVVIEKFCENVFSKIIDDIISKKTKFDIKYALKILKDAPSVSDAVNIIENFGSKYNV